MLVMTRLVLFCALICGAKYYIRSAIDKKFGVALVKNKLRLMESNHTLFELSSNQLKVNGLYICKNHYLKELFPCRVSNYYSWEITDYGKYQQIEGNDECLQVRSEDLVTKTLTLTTEKCNLNDYTQRWIVWRSEGSKRTDVMLYIGNKKTKETGSTVEDLIRNDDVYEKQSEMPESYDIQSRNGPYVYDYIHDPFKINYSKFKRVFKVRSAIPHHDIYRKRWSSVLSW